MPLSNEPTPVFRRCPVMSPNRSDARCEREAGHSGWHNANLSGWPRSIMDPVRKKR